MAFSFPSSPFSQFLPVQLALLPCVLFSSYERLHGPEGGLGFDLRCVVSTDLFICNQSPKPHRSGELCAESGSLTTNRKSDLTLYTQTLTKLWLVKMLNYSSMLLLLEICCSEFLGLNSDLVLVKFCPADTNIVHLKFLLKNLNTKKCKNLFISIIPGIANQLFIQAEVGMCERSI